MPWNKENIKNHKGMLGLKHKPETIYKMKVIAKTRGNNGVGKLLVGIPRPKSVKQKMKKTMFKKGMIPWNKGKPYLALRGEKHPNWKGGASKNGTRKSIMTTLEYKLWRRSVFERDNYTCLWCGQRGGKLNADHIKKWCDYPELRFAIDNGRTLCVECHRKTDTWGCKRPE